MNVEEYLRQNYPNVKTVEPITVDGVVKGYYARGQYAYDEIYIPASALNGTNVGMVSYIPGAGGSGNDAVGLRSRIKNNPPDYIVSIAAECSDRNYCMETAYNMAQGLGINVTNNTTVCFSASGYRGIQRTNEFLQKHSDVSTTVISCEPYPGSDSPYNCKPENIAAMVQGGTKIMFVTPQRFHINMQDELATLQQNGIEAYWLRTDYKGNVGAGVHVATSRDILACGILDYILGYSDDFNKEPGGDQFSPGWTLFGYDPVTGQLVAGDYASLVQNGIGIVRNPDQSVLEPRPPNHFLSVNLMDFCSGSALSL